ncbi:MAG TPA: PIG-L family deacetylase [Calditrichaeota bacterium]|nr:PIG-L family deacetylase [Calditrichota bacterium]
MKSLPFKKILALSAHTDDIEFGCGATLHRLLEQNSEIHVIVFSICEDSVPNGLSKDVLLHEMYRSAKMLGIKKENIEVHRFPVRKFPQYRQEILEILVAAGKKIKPDLVFTHSTQDVHQDHHTVAEESIRAFRFTTLLGFELPWNNIISTSQVIVEVNENNLQAKTQAVACYESQNFRSYAEGDIFLSQAKLRGIQGRKPYAEAFEAIRFIF